MGLLDNLEVSATVLSCKVRTIAKTLDADDQKILYAAIDNHEWSIQGLERVLAERGVSISSSSMRKHRTKLCSCSLIK